MKVYDPLKCYDEIYKNLPCGVHFIPIVDDLTAKVMKVVVYKKGDWIRKTASEEERAETLKHFEGLFWNRKFPTEFSEKEPCQYVVDGVSYIGKVKNIKVYKKAMNTGEMIAKTLLKK